MATTGPPNQQKHSNISLQCIQINLKHSKTATDNFNQLMKGANIDIAFIQEPYNYQNQVIEIPENVRYSPVEGSGRGLLS
jgi:hypothetical protein